MLKKLIRRLVWREKADSQTFVAHLKKLGVQIGADVDFYSPPHTMVDVSCPCLLTIGSHVRITHGVIILTHDYAWSVIKGLPEQPGQILGARSPVTIGNNVFIGMNAIITRGVTVGDHVIIGAGSVVTGDCESGWVYAGNPAKKLMTLEQYRQKREALQFDEAKALARSYRARFGKNPPPEVFDEYFMLFCTAEDAASNPRFRFQMETGMGFEECVTYMEQRKPRFRGFAAFLQACLEE